jgi:hypothetical protein
VTIPDVDDNEGWIARAWARIRGATRPEPPPPSRLLHWAQDNAGIPYCGARLGLRWTRVPEDATCELCRKEAAPMILQYRMNTR